MTTAYRSISLFFLTLFAAAFAIACGANVERLSLHDTRLTLDDRRWLADAEDEVSIARAGHAKAVQELEHAREFDRYVNDSVDEHWPRAGAASAARDKLENLADERITLAQLEVDAAEENLERAQAQLVRARAETAVRADIAAYDLEPIKQAADDARSSYGDVIKRVEQQRAKVDTATSEWWQAYGAYLKGGGRNDVLWLWQDEE